MDSRLRGNDIERAGMKKVEWMGLPRRYAPRNDRKE